MSDETEFSGRAPEAPTEEAPRPDGPAGMPFLSASFFSKLVHQPSCQTKGICDNCGRCER